MAKITSFHRLKYDLQTSFNPLVKLMTLSLSKILVIKMLTFTSDDAVATTIALSQFRVQNQARLNSKLIPTMGETMWETEDYRSK